jgi:hypothetical protein
MLRPIPSLNRFLFTDLAAAFLLRPGEYLIIGPSEKADHPYLVGGRFFTRQESDVDRYETLFRITPQPYQSLDVQRQSS